MYPNLDRKEHGHRDPNKGVVQQELDAAQHLAAAQESPAELGALLENHDSVLVRMAAESQLWEAGPSGKSGYAELWETDPQLLERVMATDPYEWVYDGIMRAAALPSGDSRTFEASMAALVRVSREAKSELRRRLALQILARIREADLGQGELPVKRASEPALSNALLHDESNYNRVEVASEILDAPYRHSEELVEFARQWLLHTGLRRPSKDPGWSKTNGYFAHESAPLLNPDWNPGAASFPVDGASARSPEMISSPGSAAGVGGGIAPSTQPAAPSPGHVTIEHTKKSIKAQRVVARTLFVVGVGLLLVDTEFRFQLAFGVMAVAALWLILLRVRRWWEHA